MCTECCTWPRHFIDGNIYDLIRQWRVYGKMMVQQRGTRDLHRIESRMAGAIPLCAVRQAFIVVVGNHGMMPDGWHSRWRAGEGSGKFSLFLFCSSPLIPVLFFGRSQIFSFYLSLFLSLLAPGKLYFFVYSFLSLYLV